MPKSESSWNEHDANLKAARILAEFLNLRADGVGYFQKRHPKFILAWFGWVDIQRQMQALWVSGFPQVQVLRAMAQNDLMPGGELITTTQNSVGKTASTSQNLADYQDELIYKRAILFLFTEAWRAKTCGRCGKHFIADHSRSKFCTVDCSAQARQDYKVTRHQRVKKKLNARRRREYAAAKKNTKS